MARRGSGEGTVRRRDDGRWEGRLRLAIGDRRSVFGRTQREVVAKLRALKGEQDAGLNGRRQKLARYVTTWLEQRDPRRPSAGVRQLRYTTWAGYEARMRRHILPTLGNLELRRVTPDHVRGALARLAESGLSPTTVACTRDTLATILGRAVKDRLIPFNAAAAVDSVQRAKAHQYVLDAKQATAFLRAAVGDPLEALFVVTLHVGLRQSEVLGLQWDDLDLDRATLTVRHALARVKGQGLQTFDPKTTASGATIPLPPNAVVALRAHRERVIADGRLPAGYVFATGIGTPISASNMLRSSFYPLCERAGIPTRPGLRFHDLRHSCGSLLVQAGVRPKDVQAILRHSKVSTTMDLYVHSYDEDLRAAVGSLDRALGS